jgi:uncharacterized membrane protein
MELLQLVRFVHVIGAAVLLGTGAGIAFFMVMAHRTRTPALIAHVAATVVIADFVFTASAVVVQPVTGFTLALMMGHPLTEGWILASLALYLLAGALWLPVVWIQMQLWVMAESAAATGAALPAPYRRLFRLWLACGVPALTAVLAILWLMVARPSFRVF